MRRKRYHVLLTCLTVLFVTTVTRAEEQQAEGKKRLIRIGGQVRLRYDATQNQYLDDLSYAPGKSETQLLNRTRIHLEANPADWVRFSVEPQFYGRWAGYDNENRLSVYQGYVEFPRLGQLPVRMKIGRQEFVYGSAFFLGNDDFYRGLMWDGAKINVQPISDLSVDLIAARRVSFTNNKAGKPGLYGFYATYSGLKETILDFYFFYNRQGFRNLYDHLPESPLWFTVGTRIEIKPVKQLTFEAEPMYQFGRVRYNDHGGSAQIRAYGGHFDLTYNFALPLEPLLHVGYAFGTGDRNTQRGTLREFHGNALNDTPVVGDIGLVPEVSGIDIGDVRASGLKVVTLSSSVKLSPKFSLCLDWHHFTADRVPEGFTRTIGSEANLFLACELSEKITIIASANRFFTADIFRQATGKNKDVDYFYLQTQIEF